MTMTPEARVAVESFRAEAMIGQKARPDTKRAADKHTVASPAADATTAHVTTAHSTTLPAKITGTDTTTPEATSGVSAAIRAPRYIVTALGRQFRVSAEMAAIFLRQVERVVEGDSSALVVLRHEEGVELLLVTDDNSFSIHALPH
ncbi:hypothetical protein P5G50_02435 [Leifsonia sp. F6_8S_P_1B]|uniref:Uncharacterized protein n=1 Tax=Leifsonia williamsii TaxID=3035919 RepID=A0ABT8K787_9MICO|nr:hypothetical protein [Leifsonia williamsii]MDN4613299.1 hypothetical protein [Leifsonia williamsii]